MFLTIIRTVLFLLAIVFLLLLIIGIAISDLFSLEFRNQNYSSGFSWVLLILLPFAIFLTLTGTIRKKNSENKNWTIFGITLFVSITTFFVMYFLTINSFGEWTNQSIIYRNKIDTAISINEQIYDVGALGYNRNSKRFVQIKPVFTYFYQVTLVDTAKINKDQWLLVNEPGNIHD